MAVALGCLLLLLIGMLLARWLFLVRGLRVFSGLLVLLTFVCFDVNDNLAPLVFSWLVPSLFDASLIF